MLELLRHGDTGQIGFRGQLDDPLSAVGWAQMEAAVAGRYWQRIASSPLQRCHGFAQTLSMRLGVPLQVEPALAEYDFGEWTGRTPAELHAEQPDALGQFWADPAAHPPPGAEPLLAFAQRVNDALLRLRTVAKEQRVLAVTHGGVMRLLLCQQRGWPLSRMSAIDVPHACLVRLRPAAAPAGGMERDPGLPA